MLKVDKNLVIYGAHNRGKTTIISNIHREILKLGAKSLFYQKDENSDFAGVIEFNSKFIGFYSAGDYGEVVKDGIKLLEKEILKLEIEKLDYLVCATRTHGSSVDSLEKFVKYSESFWFDSLSLSYPSDKVSINILNSYIEFQTKRVVEFIY